MLIVMNETDFQELIDPVTGSDDNDDSGFGYTPALEYRARHLNQKFKRSSRAC